MPKKKSLIASLLTILLAVCISLGFFYLTPKNAKAAGSELVLNDIVNEEGVVQKQSVNTLVQKLSGDSSANAWQTLNTKIAGVAAAHIGHIMDDLPKILKADDIRKNAFGRDDVDDKLIVTFGGKKWNPVYVTTDRDGNVILDLWLSETTKTLYKWSYFSTYNASNKYPLDLYASSYIRAYLNGTDYSKNGSALDGTTLDIDDSAADWINFNKSDSKFGKWIVPSEKLAYQEREDWAGLGSSYSTLTNDAYGIPKVGKYAGNNNYNVKDQTYYKDGFDAWKKDLLWLPSVSEVGSFGDTNYTKGVWYTGLNQRYNGTTAKTFWTRTGYCSNLGTICTMYGNNQYGSTTKPCDKSNKIDVRPALHLNLTKMVQSIELPTDFEEDYAGEKIVKTIPDYDRLNVVLDSASQANGAEYSNGEFSATKAGTYTLDVTPQDGYIWTDATNGKKSYTLTITPAEISISYDSTFKDDNKYVYSSEEVRHPLHFPLKDDSDYNDTYIKLSPFATQGDKGSVKIAYYYVTHSEKDHQDFVENQRENFYNAAKQKSFDPENTDPTTGWATYEKAKDKLEVNEPKGYCVFYRIEADNHDVKYGYFAVHIASEMLKITANTSLGEFTYGDGEAQGFPVDAEKLMTLVETKNIITAVTDQSGADKNNALNKKHFNFYLYKDGSDDALNLSTRLDAGDYYLGLKYIEDGSESYIHFLWNSPDGAADGAHPKLTIKPKEVALTWIGNTNWENDKNKVSASASLHTDDQFNWVYDGSEHAPTATYEDVDSVSQTATVKVDVAHSKAGTYTASVDDLKNYTFTNKSQNYKILKAKNEWLNGNEYNRQGWSVGGTPSEEVLPQDKFGNTATALYYTDELHSQPIYAFDSIIVETTIYVVVSVDGTNDYDGITGEYQFVIKQCTNHTFAAGDYKHDENNHWFECTKCHEHVQVTAHSGTQMGSDDDNHWSVCSVCGAEYNKGKHNYVQNTYNEKNPTCQQEGLRIDTCACGKTKEEILPKAEHEYPAGEYEFDSEHPELGHYQICNNCHEKSEAVAHDYQPILAVAPTCVSKGKSAGSQCSVCKHYETEPTDVPMIPHDYDENLTKTIAATCTTDGSTIKHCKTCNSDVPEVIPALGHDYGEFETTKAATCTAKGKKQQTCSRCNDVHEEDIPAIGHDFTKHDRVEPTATETGSIEYYECSICEKCYRDQEGNNEVEKSKTVLPALGTGSSGGNLNPPLGGDTGLNGNGGGSGSSGASDFLEKNLWWIILVIAIVVALIAASIIVSTVHTRRRERRADERERERDRQFETFMKMSMMHSYGGFNMAQPTDDSAAALDGQQQPAQLPFSQEMFNAAVSAAVTSALAAIKDEKGDSDSDSDGGGDVDGFYEEYHEDK